MRPGRCRAGLRLAAVLLTTTGALAFAAPAYATTGITAPGNGVTYSTDTTVRITANLDANSGSAQLRLTTPAPGSSPQTVDSESSTLTAGASLHYNLDTATCATFPSSCSGQAEAMNGSWTVTLVRGGTVVGTSSFTLRIPPHAPASLTAQASGYRTAVLNWPKGDEPDLTGWTVYGDGSPIGQVGTGACSGTSCSTTLTYGQDGTGTHTYSLVAHRSVAPGSSETLDSPSSPQASVTLTSPPPASATPASGSGSAPSGATASAQPQGGTSSTPAGSRAKTGRADPNAVGSSQAPIAVAQRPASALSFQAYAPTLGIPQLPALPDPQPALAPLPDGTYQPTLGYRDVVSRTKIETQSPAVRRLTGAVGTALDRTQLLRSLAGALVLLLAAVHLRRWLGSGRPDA